MTSSQPTTSITVLSQKFKCKNAKITATRFLHQTASTMPTQRVPLAPIDLNRPLKKELTPWQRNEIQTYRNVGLTNKDIRQLTNCTPGTVTTTLQLNTLRNNDETRFYFNRFLVLIRRDKRLILCII